MSKDFVQDILGLVQQQAGIDDRTRVAIEQSIRGKYGGERVRIRPTAPIDIGTVDAMLRERTPVTAIARDTGVHRATIYRLLKKSRIQRRNCAKT